MVLLISTQPKGHIGFDILMPPILIPMDVHHQNCKQPILSKKIRVFISDYEMQGTYSFFAVFLVNFLLNWKI